MLAGEFGRPPHRLELGMAFGRAAAAPPEIEIATSIQQIDSGNMTLAKASENVWPTLRMWLFTNRSRLRSCATQRSQAYTTTAV